MKVRKFLGSNSREALRRARTALGDDAVVLSSRQSPEGFELVALAKDDIGALVSHTKNEVVRKKDFSEPKKPEPVKIEPAQSPDLVNELRALRGLVQEQA